jgi:hypothetical protein
VRGPLKKDRKKQENGEEQAYRESGKKAVKESYRKRNGTRSRTRIGNRRRW